MAHYEPGLYDCIVTGHGLAESKEKKTPYVFLQFQPVKHNGFTIDGEYTREVKLWLTEKTAETTLERLRAMGWHGTSFKELASTGQGLKGANIVVRCEHSQQDGKVYEDWQLPAPQSAGSENKPDLARRLDALFEKVLKTKGAVTAAPAKTLEQQVEAMKDDVDVPF